jgi:DNA-binding response OmpR family regulator
MNAKRRRGVRFHGPIVVAKSTVSSFLAEAEALAEAGFLVFHVTSSDEAISYLESRSDIRLLIVDLNVRGCFDGAELAHFVEKRWPDIGVVVLGIPVQPIFRATGATFISTPCARPILIDRVRARLHFTVFSNQISQEGE